MNLKINNLRPPGGGQSARLYFLQNKLFHKADLILNSIKKTITRVLIFFLKDFIINKNCCLFMPFKFYSAKIEEEEEY
jgi:hypothetical protein